MRLTWDPEKSAANVRERGFGFDFAARIFSGPTLERVDDRRDYGEMRVVAIGETDGLVLTVVYTDREHEEGTVRRVISARPSNRSERDTYSKRREQAE